MKGDRFIFYVDDLDEAIRIFPLVRYKNLLIYFFVWHPELTFIQNILCNFSFRIREKEK